MSGILFVRAMETMMQMDDNEKCPKCGREGCTCDPDSCDCEPVVDQQEDLIQDFEE